MLPVPGVEPLATMEEQGPAPAGLPAPALAAPRSLLGPGAAKGHRGDRQA